MTRDETRSSAPGKVILFGEHAVVYGEPAIAVPVTQVEATVKMEASDPGNGLTVVAADLGKTMNLAEAPADDPLAVAAHVTLDHLGASVPDATLTVRSTIPMASGLGSSAAVAAALVRALAAFHGTALSAGDVSELVYEVEKIHHGTPSGIDNTVIAYEQPVYFVRTDGSRPETMSVGLPFRLVIADSGLPSPTKRLVDRVRTGWLGEPTRYEALFGQIGDTVRKARRRIEAGEVQALGPLVDRNHALLVELGVSSSRLNRLVNAARAAGAWGAKLSGAGQGGNVLALAEEESLGEVAAALREAGAVSTIETTVT